MKIVFLNDHFPAPGFGGATVSTYELALGFKNCGHEVSIISTCRTKSEAGKSEQGGVTIFKIASDYPGFWRAYLSLYNPLVVRKVGRLLRAIKPDVVHANNIHFFLSYHCLKVARKHSKIVVFTARDVMTFNYGKLTTKKYLENFDARTTWLDHVRQAGRRWNPFRNYFIKKYLRYADQIFAVSNSLKRALAQNGIKNVLVMHTGINIKDWQTKKLPGNRFIEKYHLGGKKVVLFGGRLSGAKGGVQALALLDKIKNLAPDAILLIIGRADNYADQIRERARRLGLLDKLLFTGWLGRDEIKQIYDLADLVLVPSVCFDSLPRVVLEAMAAGKPVVGTCYGGTPEAVIDGVTGYVVNPFDINKMAEKVIYLLKNPQEAEKMGKMGRERIFSDFNLKTKVSGLLRFYDSSLAVCDENKDCSVISVENQKWLDAQTFERRCWTRDNQHNSRLAIILKFLRTLKKSPKRFFELIRYRDFYVGDDWNFWWKEKFDNYQILPSHFGAALEVGCGPYTNIRIISKLKKIDKIYCVDPLMNLYLSFKLNWLTEMSKKGKIFTSVGRGESLEFPNKSFDLVVCNNVLDHVQDARACLSEISRVLKVGGYFVFGQDLSSETDINKQQREDRGFIGHPIKLHHQTLDQLLGNMYEIKMRKILPRVASRNPRHHYGTYIFVGAKK